MLASFMAGRSPECLDQALLLVLRHLLPSSGTHGMQDAALDAALLLNHPLFKGMIMALISGIGLAGHRPCLLWQPAGALTECYRFHAAIRSCPCA